MNPVGDAPRDYRMVFRGECGRVFADVFSDVTIESRHGYTCVMATVRDASEFYGLLERFQDLALQPVSINEIGPGGGDEEMAAALATFASPPPGSPG
jgi:hypothetical protein